MPDFKPYNDDRAEKLLRLYANDLIRGKSPSERMLTTYTGPDPITWEEGLWVHKAAGEAILYQLDGNNRA